MIKGAVKAEVATASIPQTSSRTLQSPVDALHVNESVRVKAEVTNSATPRKRFACVSSKVSSRLNCVSVAFSSATLPSTKPALQRVSRRESTPVRVKPEVVASTIPRKRLSDVAFPSESQHIDSFASSKESLPKKAKTKATAKTPLGQVTNTTVASASNSSAAMYPSFPMDPFDNPFHDPFNDPYTKLQNIQIEMAIQENALDDLRRKPSLSAEDHWSVVHLQNELQRLRDLEMETNFFLMDSQPVPKNWSIIRSEPVVDEVEKLANIVNRRYSSPLADRKPNVPQPYVPQPFPMSMEVDRKPFIKPEPPAAPQSFRMAMQVDRKPFIKPEPPAVPRLSLPALSSIPTTNQPHFLPPSALERKLFVTPPKQPVAQPVASGSKAPSPPFPKYEPFLPSDDLDMNPSDSESEDYFANVNPAIAYDLVDRIGINIPPPIENDAQDDNGDYYGRGRDLFEGPRARADE